MSVEGTPSGIPTTSMEDRPPASEFGDGTRWNVRLDDGTIVHFEVRDGSWVTASEEFGSIHAESQDITGPGNRPGVHEPKNLVATRASDASAKTFDPANGATAFDEAIKWINATSGDNTDSGWLTLPMTDIVCDSAVRINGSNYQSMRGFRMKGFIGMNETQRPYPEILIGASTSPGFAIEKIGSSGTFVEDVTFRGNGQSLSSSDYLVSIKTQDNGGVENIAVGGADTARALLLETQDGHANDVMVGAGGSRGVVAGANNSNFNWQDFELEGGDTVIEFFAGHGQFANSVVEQGGRGIYVDTKDLTLGPNLNVVTNQRRGIHTSGNSSFATIENNLLKNNNQSNGGYPAIEVKGWWTTVEGNKITSDTPHIRVDSAGEVRIKNNQYEGTGTAIEIVGSAQDVWIEEPQLTWGDISDGGTRTVLNGVGLNAGDPNSTGQWNGVGREGVTVRDTTNANTYLYNNGSWSQIASA